MKKLIVYSVLSALLAASTIIGFAKTPETISNKTQVLANGNYTNEMKIPYKVNINKENGSDSVERKGDHQNSPYFAKLDFYNMKSTDTLTILPKFKTQQQTSEWSCGISAMTMVMEYYGKLGNYTEESLAQMRSNKMAEEATYLKDVVSIFKKVGFDVESTYDYPAEKIYEFMTLEQIQKYLKEGKPIIAAWNDWGGHYQVIIGYDTLGTKTTQDDVIIVADSYDTTDHNQDGYGIYPAERFYYNWTMYDFFTKNYGVDERDMLFCVATPKSK
ncbi:MAG: papain-like cysteine protease family protein [Filifactoraceae bacterium]